MWFPVWFGYSQLQDQHHLRGHLIDLVQVDHPWAGGGQLQHRDLVDDVHAAVLAFPPLPHELGGIFVARAFLHTLSDHSELSPGRQDNEYTMVTQKIQPNDKMTKETKNVLKSKILLAVDSCF